MAINAVEQMSNRQNTPTTILDVAVYGGEAGKYSNFHALFPARDLKKRSWIGSESNPLSARITMSPDRTHAKLVVRISESTGVTASSITYRNEGPDSTFAWYFVWLARNLNPNVNPHIPTTFMDHGHLPGSYIYALLHPFDRMVIHLSRTEMVKGIDIGTDTKILESRCAPVPHHFGMTILARPDRSSWKDV